MKKNPPLATRPVHEYAHETAYKLACERTAGFGDIELQCRKSGARYLPAEKSVIIDHLNRFYRITLPGCDVASINNDEAVPLRDKILILHYFNHASGKPLSGKIVGFDELQESGEYPAFVKRAIGPIVNAFKEEPQKLLEAAATLGGHRSDYGDIAITIDAFPCVPLTVVLWQGDQETQPGGNILFDSSIADYLPAEDIIILCEVIAWKLVRLLKTGGDTTGKGQLDR